MRQTAHKLLDDLVADKELDWLHKNMVEYGKQEHFGSFNNAQHYLTTLKLLLSSTDETTNRVRFFNKDIMPFTKSGHLLDIGIGDGLLAKNLGKHFSTISLIDPSEEALSCVQPHDFSHQPSIRKICSDIQNVRLDDESTDLALLSHCLYYIDVEHWLSVVNTVFRALKPGGMLVIVLNGGLDKDSLAKKFNGKYINMESLARDCSNHLNLKSLKLVYDRTSFITSTLAAMLHIVGLHLFDIGSIASKEQLTEFLKSLHQSNKYQFNIYQKFLILTKQTSIDHLQEGY